MTGIRRITTRDDLIALASELGVRMDWHEPGNQGVTAAVFGTELDNTGGRAWGSAAAIPGGTLPPEQVSEGMEMWVVLYQDGKAVAEVNLALLLAFATGWSG
jgi:hypothetical protein